MKKTILLAAVAAFAVTSAQAEDIYMAFNSTKMWTTSQSFERVFVSGAMSDKKEEILVTAEPAGRQGNLIISTSIVAPGSSLVARRKIVLLDAADKVVAELNVIITPTGAPVQKLNVLRNGSWQELLCNSRDCSVAYRAKDPKAEEVTHHKDGSVTVRKEY